MYHGIICVICYWLVSTALFLLARYLLNKEPLSLTIASGDRGSIQTLNLAAAKQTIGRSVKQIFCIAFVLSAVLAILILAIAHTKTAGYDRKISLAIPIIISTYCVWNLTLYLIRWFDPRKNHVFWHIVLPPISTATIVSAWIFHPNWITLDATAFIMTVWLLLSFRLANFMTGLIVSLALMLYDSAAVLGTGMMIKLANSTFGNTPHIIIMPSSLSASAKTIFEIGIGDIFVSGLVLMLVFRHAKKYKAPLISRVALAGYFLGIALTYGMAKFTGRPQPATIYLLPAIIGAFVIAMYCKGLGKELLKASVE